MYLYSLSLADVLKALTGAFNIWNYNMAFLLDYGLCLFLIVLCCLAGVIVLGDFIYGPPGILALPEDF